MKGKYVRVLENKFNKWLIIYSRNTNILQSYDSMGFKSIHVDMIADLSGIPLIAYLADDHYDPTGVASHLKRTFRINPS